MNDVPIEGRDDNGGSGGGDRPAFVNRDAGVAAWLNEDKNGNAYISVKLPLGLGTVNLFANDDQDSSIVSDALNSAARYVKENR